MLLGTLYYTEMDVICTMDCNIILNSNGCCVSKFINVWLRLVFTIGIAVGTRGSGRGFTQLLFSLPMRKVLDGLLKRDESVHNNGSTDKVYVQCEAPLCLICIYKYILLQYAIVKALSVTKVQTMIP